MSLLAEQFQTFFPSVFRASAVHDTGKKSRQNGGSCDARQLRLSPGAAHSPSRGIGRRPRPPAVLIGRFRECLLLLVAEACRRRPPDRAPPRPSRPSGRCRPVFGSACVSVLAPPQINKTGILLTKYGQQNARFVYLGLVRVASGRGVAARSSHAAPHSVPAPVRRGRLSALAWRGGRPLSPAPP